MVQGTAAAMLSASPCSLALSAALLLFSESILLGKFGATSPANPVEKGTLYSVVCWK